MLQTRLKLIVAFVLVTGNMPKVTKGYISFRLPSGSHFFSQPLFFFNLVYCFVRFYDIDVGCFRHKQTLVATCYFLFVDPCLLYNLLKIRSGSRLLFYHMTISNSSFSAQCRLYFHSFHSFFPPSFPIFPSPFPIRVVRLFSHFFAVL